MGANHAETPATDPMVGEIVLLLRKVIYAPEGSISADTRLEDLGLDSLDLIEAGLELEALVGRDIVDSALQDVRTVGDLARCFGNSAPRHGLSLAA